MSISLCPKCNAEISSLSLACPACGAPLSGVAPPPSTLRGTKTPLPFKESFGGILASPGDTFGRILEGPRGRHAWVMLLLTAFISSTMQTIQTGKFWHILIFPIVAFACYLFFWLFAWLFRVTGGWLGGSGSIPELFDVQVWAAAPGLISGAVQLAGILNQDHLWHLAWGCLYFGVAIWAFIVLLILLSIAQRFSIGMALLNFIMTMLLLFVPIAAVIFICELLFRF